MKKILSAIVLSLVFSLLFITPTHKAIASEMPTIQDKQWVDVKKEYSVDSYPNAPPDKYFYDNGVYRGYIPLEDYVLDAGNEIWIASYSGYVYTGAVPIPPNSTNDK